ncbi:hypothetical protein QYM36_013605 [Artemia franciscana]|uniref:Uncharacterized protein n=1 Tax=Artemia franciscana TaxID=6661 RepID=A0AA88HQG6_ARTSF|nr:hypothetical protein QYM36_013605 [Artemia franciscana]
MVASSFLRHKSSQHITWHSSNNDIVAHLGYILVKRRWRSSVQDTRAYRGAYTESRARSDHTLVGANILLCLSMRRKVTAKKRFNIAKVSFYQAKYEFCLQLQNRFNALPIDAQDPEEIWLQFKTTTAQVATDILGYSHLSRQS